MDETLTRLAGQLDARQIAERLMAADLQKSLRRPRTLFSFLMSTIVAGLTFVALIPLFSVVYMLVVRGFSKLSLSVFTSLPPAVLEEGGGFGNALIGTLIIVAIASLISIPFGIMGAIYLAEVAPPDSRLAKAVRFSAKVLTGFPSILAGVLAYGVIVRVLGFSAWAGGAALSLLMIPTIMLTSEEAIRMVPARIREAAIGIGATSMQSICRVLLPTALPGILTGVMLAIARAAGETAPLLVTALFSNNWPWSHCAGCFLSYKPDLAGPTPSLAVLIYNFSSSFDDNQKDLAWAAALVLVFLVLAINLVGQAFSNRKAE
jgi:phosphate transport system permease protein